MSNTYLTIGMVTKEALMVLVNECAFTKKVNREYDDKFGVDGAKIGNVLNIRKPPRYLTAVGQALSIEDATETSVPLTLNTQRHLGLAFSSQDLVLSIDQFSKRFIRPGISTLSNYIDYDGLQQFQNIFSEVGVPGTVPNQALTYLQAHVALSNLSIPFKDRHLCISPNMNAVAVDTLKGLFQSSERIKEQYEEGMMSEGALGSDWWIDQNVPTQTVGTCTGTPVVTTTANQNGSTILSTGWTASTLVLNKGDIITFAGCYSVNPQNRQSNGTLAQWVVTAPVTSGSGAGAASIPIAGPDGNGVITAGPFQNSSASPTASGTITVQGASGTSSPRGMLFHETAFTLGMADLVLPGGVDIAERASSKELKASIRLIRAYDINMDRFPFRADILYGWATLYPQAACRVAS